MSGWSWVAGVGGALLAAAVLIDVFLSVLHLDVSGPIASALRTVIYRPMLYLAKRLRPGRRAILAIIGPVTLTATSVTWFSLFILAFALMVWPHMDEGFHSVDPLEELTFVDALYYSGGTGTVLGFGDITPLTSLLKVLAFIEAGLGFVIITGAIAYILNITGAVAERNALAVRVYNQTGRTGDGVYFVLRVLEGKGKGALGNRLNHLLTALQSLQGKLHEFASADILYRSLNHNHDPEPMLRSLTDISIASLVIADVEEGHYLQVTASDLSEAVTDIIYLIADRYFPSSLRQRLRHPEPTLEDQHWVEDIRMRLSGSSRGSRHPNYLGVGTQALDLAFRRRLFLEGLDHLTGWRMDRPA